MIRIRGGTIVTMDADDRVFDGDLRVEGKQIAALGETLAPRGDETLIDASDCLVLPGFIQAHTHVCQTLIRNLADDRTLMHWLRDRVWPFEAAYDSETIGFSARLGLAELLKGGTSTILDMATVHDTDAVFEAASESGIRAFIGKAMMDLDGGQPAPLQEETEASLEESVALAKRWHGADEGRLRYALAPRFAISCTDDLLRSVADIARDEGLLLHTHASETTFENEEIQRTRGRTNIEHLHAIGFLEPDCCLAHGVHTRPGEFPLLGDASAAICHCPSSNLKLGSGIAPLPTYFDHGITVAIGADGAPCNNNLDILREMRLAALLQKGVTGDPTILDARQVVRMGTIDGARALHIEEETGSIEIGKKADLVILKRSPLHGVPFDADDPYAQVVYSLSARDVRDLFVDGRPVVRNGALLTLDEEGLRGRAQEQARRVADRAAEWI